MVRTIKVYSDNDVFQRLAALSKNRRKRHQAKLCLVEGVRPISLALANHWDVAGLVYAKGSRLSGWAENILSTSGAGTHYELSPHLMQALSDKEETSELIAIVMIPGDEIERITIRGVPLLVVLDQPSSPGNLGSAVRSCDAFRADGVAVLGHSADVYDPQAIRASLGTVFSTPIVRLGSHDLLTQWLTSLREAYPGFQVIGTSAKADADLADVDLTQPVALVLGNETQGMSWYLRCACDLAARIPIHGSASSLNLACATSIALYEIDRQRRLASPAR